MRLLKITSIEAFQLSSYAVCVVSLYLIAKTYFAFGWLYYHVCVATKGIWGRQSVLDILGSG